MRRRTRISSWCAALLLACTGASQFGAQAQSAHPDDPTGEAISCIEYSLTANQYITEPSCGFYQCSVTWQKGEAVAVNWLNPIKGQVSVQLISQIGGPTYTIVSSIPGTSQEGYCDSGYGARVLVPGRECGRIRFNVPEGWQELVNYTVAVTSLDDSSVAGYTDNVNIVPAANGADPGPSGTRISLITIQAPTSTNYDGAVSETGQAPSLTAVTAVSSSTTTPASSSVPASSSAPRSSSASSRASNSQNSSASRTSSASSQNQSSRASSAGPSLSGTNSASTANQSSNSQPTSSAARDGLESALLVVWTGLVAAWVVL
ncbi:hypothetical protein ACM66B_006877 [Microbotryomycetes sp. NB124-2]